MKFPEHKDTVVLGRIACCAMHVGFQNNPQAILQLADIVPSKMLGHLLVGFRRVAKFCFVPHMTKQVCVIAYQIIAESELNRLKKNGHLRLECGCLKQEHIDALEEILIKLGTPAIELA